MRFERHYNSAWPEERTLGAQWRSHYDRQLATTATEAAITRPEGQAFLFKLVGGVWTPEVDVTERLERLTDAAGRTLRFTYDETQRLQTMTDPAGGVYSYRYD